VEICDSVKRYGRGGRSTYVSYICRVNIYVHMYAYVLVLVGLSFCMSHKPFVRYQKFQMISSFFLHACKAMYVLIGIAVACV
jgi:hypothetical protein